MQTICLDGPSAPLDAIARKVQRSKRIVVVSGAGVSCSAGIPDFRSKNGLYNLVKEEHPDAVVKGQDLFDANLFRSKKTTSVFFTFMAKLRAEMEAAEPTPAHHFLRHLRDREQLMRIYTQNIDGYEARVGVKDRTVMLHGDIHLLRCTDCKHVQPWSESDKDTLQRGKAPLCSECRDMEAARKIAGLRKRPTGVLRPQVVLYNEDHPQATEIGTVVAKDAKKRPDLLLIMGTSLKVDGIKGLVRDLSQAVRAQGGLCVFVNATPVSGSLWSSIIDYHVQSGIDEWVADLKVRAPALWLTQSHINFKPADKPGVPPAPQLVLPLKKTKRKAMDFTDIDALKAKQAKMSEDALAASLAWEVPHPPLLLPPLQHSWDNRGHFCTSLTISESALSATPSATLSVTPSAPQSPPDLSFGGSEPSSGSGSLNSSDSASPGPESASPAPEFGAVTPTTQEPRTPVEFRDPFARATWPHSMVPDVPYPMVLRQPARNYRTPLNAWNLELGWDWDKARGFENQALLQAALQASLEESTQSKFPAQLESSGQQASVEQTG